jgi:hypothetical protein
MIEEAPVFVDVQEAIAWGRARARRVVVRLGDNDTTVTERWSR